MRHDRDAAVRGTDAELSAVIDAWPRLSADDRKHVLAIILAAVGELDAG